MTDRSVDYHAAKLTGHFPDTTLVVDVQDHRCGEHRARRFALWSRWFAEPELDLQMTPRRVAEDIYDYVMES